jgi:hypothetical protein
VWADGTTLSWSVDDETSPGFWHYSYTFEVADGRGSGISHAIFEASLGLTADDLFKVSGPSEVDEFGDEGNSNPHIPGTFYGVKFQADGEDGELTLNVSFDSLRNPVWGDFYAKGGSSGSGQDQTFNAAWNDGFGDPDSDPFDPPADGSVGSHVLVPDTFEIPEPSSLALVVVGASAVALRRWRRSERA